MGLLVQDFEHLFGSWLFHLGATSALRLPCFLLGHSLTQQSMTLKAGASPTYPFLLLCSHPYLRHLRASASHAQQGSFSSPQVLGLPPPEASWWSQRRAILTQLCHNQCNLARRFSPSLPWPQGVLPKSPGRQTLSGVSFSPSHAFPPPALGISSRRTINTQSILKAH